MIDPKLLQVLCCPETRAELIEEGDSLISTDRGSRRKYPVKNRIPVLLKEESVQLGTMEWEKIMQQHNQRNKI